MGRKLAMLILTTVLSLILTIISFYDGARYLKYRFVPSMSTFESLTAENSKLKKFDDSRLVVAFSTTPERVGKIAPMLKSLLDQTVKIDSIEINVAPSSATTLEENFPKQCESFLSTFKAGKDWGAATKIIPTILRETESDTRIIYLSDKYIYGKDFVESLLEESAKTPNAAIITTDSFNSDNGAILVKPGFFNSSVIDSVIDADVKFKDDSWLNDYLTCETRPYKYIGNFRY